MRSFMEMSKGEQSRRINKVFRLYHHAPSMLANRLYEEYRDLRSEKILHQLRELLLEECEDARAQELLE